MESIAYNLDAELLIRVGEELLANAKRIELLRQIQQLEQSLGVALFERRHRALALTEAGRVMH